MAFMVNTVADRWIQRGNFVVVDNTVLHSGGSADMLAKFLWDAPGLDGAPLRVAITPFPTRSPELNPIELSWNTFVKRLKVVRISVLAKGGDPEVMKTAACNILNKFTQTDNQLTYRHCGYYGRH